MDVVFTRYSIIHRDILVRVVVDHETHVRKMRRYVTTVNDGESMNTSRQNKSTYQVL